MADSIDNPKGLPKGLKISVERDDQGNSFVLFTCLECGHKMPHGNGELPLFPLNPEIECACGLIFVIDSGRTRDIDSLCLNFARLGKAPRK
jgi:hypothetical protein